MSFKRCAIYFNLFITVEMWIYIKSICIVNISSRFTYCKYIFPQHWEQEMFIIWCGNMFNHQITQVWDSEDNLMNIDSVHIDIHKVFSQQLCNWWYTVAGEQFQHESPPGNCLLAFPVCNKALSLVLTGSSHEVTPFNKIFVYWAKDWAIKAYPGSQNPHFILRRIKGFSVHLWSVT